MFLAICFDKVALDQTYFNTANALKGSSFEKRLYS